MRRFFPAKFELRERILFGLAVVLVGVAFYLISTAKPRAAPGVWIQWQFLGTVLFIAIAGRDRTFFTGLYCALLSGTQAFLLAAVLLVRPTWPSSWGDWSSELAASLLAAFGLALTVAIPTGLAWCVTRLIACLERWFCK